MTDAGEKLGTCSSRFHNATGPLHPKVSSCENWHSCEPIASPQATRPLCKHGVEGCALCTAVNYSYDAAQPAAGTTRCPTCGIGMDTNGDGDCDVCTSPVYRAFSAKHSEGTTPQAERLDFLHDGKWYTRARCCNNGFMHEEHDCLKARAVAPVETPDDAATWAGIDKIPTGRESAESEQNKVGLGYEAPSLRNEPVGVETRLTELPYSPDDLQLEKAVGTIGIIALAGLPENSGFFFDAPKVRAVISEYAAQSKASVETPGVQVIAFGTFNSGFLQHVSTTRLDAEAWARHHLADSPEVEIKRMTFYRAPEPPERKVETRLFSEIKPVGSHIIDHPKLSRWLKVGYAEQRADGLWVHYTAICTLLKESEARGETGLREEIERLKRELEKLK